MPPCPRPLPVLAAIAAALLLLGCAEPGADEMVRPAWAEVSYAHPQPAHPPEPIWIPQSPDKSAASVPATVAEKWGQALVDDAADQKAHQKLRTRIPKLECRNLAVVEVVEFFIAASNVSFHVDWKALEEANVKKDTPVSLSLQNVTVGSALAMVLGDLADLRPWDITAASSRDIRGWSSPDEKSDDLKLTSVIVAGVVNISTRKSLANRFFTRIYDIHDIVTPIPEPLRSSPTSDELAKQVMDTIKDVVGKDSWGPAGKGTIEYRGRCLIVNQTDDNQRRVVDLLEQLRETRTLGLGAEVVLMHLNAHAEKALLDHLTRLPPVAVKYPSVEHPHFIATTSAPCPGSPTTQPASPRHWVLGAEQSDAFLKTALAAKGVRVGKMWQAGLFNAQQEMIPDAHFPVSFLPLGSTTRPANVMWTFIESTISADRRYLTTSLRCQALSPIRRLPGVDLGGKPITLTYPDGATFVVEMGKGDGWSLWAVVRGKILIPCECEHIIFPSDGGPAKDISPGRIQYRNAFQPSLAGPATLERD